MSSAAVSCKYQEVQPMPGQNLQEIFTIRFPDGKTERVTRHSGDDYKHKTVIQFFCVEKFESANRNQDQNITCGPRGEWVPKLTPCIRKQYFDTLLVAIFLDRSSVHSVYISARNTSCFKTHFPSSTEQSEELPLGQKKHYVPPPQDAPQAGSVGVIVISILVIFFSFIIILDLSTLTRDVKTLKSNVIHLRDRVKYRKSK